MSTKLIGAHMPTSGGGLEKAVRDGKAIGCTAIQVFTSSPQQWRAKAVTQPMIDGFKTACAETGIGKNVVSHDSYLVNLASMNEELREKSREGLRDELLRCHLYGIPYVVSHIGSHKGEGLEVGHQRASEKVLEILDTTPDDVTLLMETTAGQGSSLNVKFEELAILLNLCGGHPRLCVCLDTCHIFAAGYDIRTAEGYEATFAEFDRLVGLDRLKVVHCNDSKYPLDSRRDRHENLGDGLIGPTPFECLVNDDRLDHVMVVIETPDADTMHAVNVGRLWGWQAS